MHFSRFALSALIALGLLACQSHTEPAPKQAAASAFEVIPPNKDNDLRIFYADGRIAKGTPALEKMNTDANLTLWSPGNQFFAMEDVIHTFRKRIPKPATSG